MNYFAGLDGGSTYLKAALINQDSVVIDTLVNNTGIDNSGNAEKLIYQLAQRAKINRTDIKYIVATGYSRKVLDIADDDVSEITAHAYGVRLTAPPATNPGLIIDIGGQDSKLIYLDRQFRVKNFTMNDKCAAGTGKFLEVIAQILETTIDKIGPLSLESTAPCDINSMCVVFAQSEVVSLVARRYNRRDILGGVHLSMAKRIAKMTRKTEINGDIIMTGGGALNIGLHKAFETELMADIHVAKFPQFNGSLGAALLARERMVHNGERQFDRLR
jgi:predicted CoA-substrate-specific enzyme activase